MATTAVAVTFFCGGVVEKKKVTKTIVITFFCGAVAEKKKATAVVVVIFFFVFFYGGVTMTLLPSLSFLCLRKRKRRQ
jgi:hypothetical protein